MKKSPRILVPYDFSGHSGGALYVAADLARRLEAEIRLLHVLDAPADPFPPVDGAGAELLAGRRVPHHDIVYKQADEALSQVAGTVASELLAVDGRVVESHHIADAICDAAEAWLADLIAMGTHGRTGFTRAFVGSVAERTVRNAPCPVLTVRDRGDSS